MKNILNFNEFINESRLNESMSVTKAHKILLDGFSADDFIKEKSSEPESKDLVLIVTQICKLLGEVPEKVAGLDQYTDDPEELADLYDKLDKSFRGDNVAGVGTQTEFIRFDKKMNVISLDSMSDDFVIYWFTAKSKF